MHGRGCLLVLSAGGTGAITRARGLSTITCELVVLVDLDEVGHATRQLAGLVHIGAL